MMILPDAPTMRAMVARLEPLLLAGAPLKRGAAELIDVLAQFRLPLAVATSMKRADALHHLGMHKLDGFFELVVGRDDVLKGKPFPDVHLKAASGIGVAPFACLVLEDSFNGVKAAHAAGAMTVMVPDVVAPTPEIAALCVGVADDLNQVRDVITSALADRCWRFQAPR